MNTQTFQSTSKTILVNEKRFQGDGLFLIWTWKVDQYTVGLDSNHVFLWRSFGVMGWAIRMTAFIKKAYIRECRA